MRRYPKEDDQEELADLNAAPWMVAALRLNPEYVHWGPYEDYMCDTKAGWGAPVFKNGWAEMAGWAIDELNELVNFYFEISRNSEECATCAGECYNPATAAISRSFYDFDHTGLRWCDAITQDESDMLWDKGRLRMRFNERPFADVVNAYEKQHSIHDAINRMMLIEHRATRQGVYGWCDTCKGSGRTFTESAAHLNLILWFIHPRKGASRGVEVKNIQKDDMPQVVAYLKQAAERNAARFAAITEL